MLLSIINLKLSVMLAVAAVWSLLGCEELSEMGDWRDYLDGNSSENGGDTNDEGEPPPLETVAAVDLGRYVGTWYEIAAFPQRFQAGCTGTTATYTLRDDGDIDVLNRCFIGSLSGEEDVSQGVARVVNSETNAELEVSFFRPFWGDYWIIDLDPEYRYAVVGAPGRDYLWILSRTPTMEEAVYEGILDRILEKDYSLDRLEKTIQFTAADGE